MTVEPRAGVGLDLYLSGRQEQADLTVWTRQFCHCLGREIVSGGHTLRTGGAPGVAKLASEGAASWCEAQGIAAEERIVHRPRRDRQPAYRIGRWEPVPEPPPRYVPVRIAEADAVILVHGTSGTRREQGVAEGLDKPVVPVGATGGAAEEAWRFMARDFEGWSCGVIDRADFDALGREEEPAAQAERVLRIAERLVVELRRRQQEERRAEMALEAIFQSFPDGCAIQYELILDGVRQPGLIRQEVSTALLRGMGRQLQRVADEAAGIHRGRPAPPADLHSLRLNLERIGRDAAKVVWHPEVEGPLQEAPPGFLRLSHDPDLNAVPWELLPIGGTPLCRRFYLGRLPRSLARPPQPRRATSPLRVLVIADPSEDPALVGARDEATRLVDLLRGEFGGQVRAELTHESDPFQLLFGELPQHDVVHFAGHSVLDDAPQGSARSGWVLDGDPHDPGAELTILSARDIAEKLRGQAPLLVFSNSCSSARSARRTGSLQQALSATVTGLAEAFLAAGVQHYVGSFWLLPDAEPTKDFALAFYETLLQGKTVGEAMHAAREAVIKQFDEDEITWAAYALFGDPTQRLIPASD